MKKKNEKTIVENEKKSDESSVTGISENAGSNSSVTDESTEPAAVNKETEMQEEKTMTEEEKNVLRNLGLYKDEPVNVHPAKKQRQARKKKTDEPTKTGLPVSGRFLIRVTDRGINSLLVAADRFANKDKSTIKVKDLVLQKDEIDDDMIQLAEECLKEMKLSADPITAFFGGMLLLSLTKFIALKYD